MTPRAIEQIFLERSAGGVKVLLVLEDDAGGRVRENLPLPADSVRDATLMVAKRLAYRGIRPAARVRLRVGRGAELRDDQELLELFLNELDRSS